MVIVNIVVAEVVLINKNTNYYNKQIEVENYKDNMFFLFLSLLQWYTIPLVMNSCLELLTNQNQATLTPFKIDYLPPWTAGILFCPCLHIYLHNLET